MEGSEGAGADRVHADKAMKSTGSCRVHHRLPMNVSRMTLVIDSDWVKISLARVHAMAEALKLANWRVATALADGNLNPADASAMKVLGTEQTCQSLRLLMEIVGSVGYLPGGSAGAVLSGQLEQAYRQAPVGTFGGGVNEVQREIIGMAGLGLPRAPR